MLSVTASAPVRDRSSRKSHGPSFCLDRPVYEQFFTYVGRVAQGDFGNSVFTGRPVVDDLMRKAELAEIRIGKRSAGRVEVLTGLTAQDEFVVAGQMKIFPGEPVAPLAANPPAAPAPRKE